LGLLVVLFAQIKLAQPQTKNPTSLKLGICLSG